MIIDEFELEEEDSSDFQSLNEKNIDTTTTLDSDGDGLDDEEEASLGTNSMLSDTDGDGLFDREEVKVYNTDPLDTDTDKDGFTDGIEVEGGYNPNGAGKLYGL